MRYEGAFLSEADGLSISTAAMIPDQKPYRAVVQLVHGMSEHKERFSVYGISGRAWLSCSDP